MKLPSAPIQRSSLLCILSIFLSCFFFTSNSLATDTTYVVLSSGIKQGTYYKVALEISDYLNQSLKTYKFFPVTSQGSGDNLRRFKEGSTDMFIVQRDEAVTVYYDDKEFKNMEIILPLFPEALQIFVKSDTNGIISFQDFRLKIASGEISHLAIGPENSSTNRTTKKILNLLQIDALEEDFFVLSSPEKYITEFLNGNIDAIAFISTIPMRQFIDKEIDSVCMVSLNDSEIKLLLNHLHNLDHLRLNVDEKIYPFLPHNEVVNCVGTWAFLVGKSGLVDAINSDENVSLNEIILVNSIQKYNRLEDWFTNGIGKHLFTTYNENSSYFPTTSEDNEVVVNSENMRLDHFFRGLPLANDLNMVFSIGILSSMWSLLFLSVVILVIFFIILRYRKKIDYSVSWNRYKHFIYTGLGIIIIYVIVAESILFMEQQFHDTYAISSPFIGISSPQMYQWLLLYVLAGYNAELFPVSYIGKLLVTASVYIIYANIGLAILLELLFNYNRKKRMLGMKKVNFKQHLVICGWNDRAPKFIKDVMEALNEYVQASRNEKKIVVINKVMKEYLENDEGLKKIHAKRKLEYVNGTPRNYKFLEAANIQEAHTVILLADNDTKEADERVLIDALTISRYCREKYNDLTNRIYMIAVINNKEFEESMYRADVNEVVCYGDMSYNIIVQTTLNHGIAKILGRLLDYNEFNEFYIIDLRNRESLRGKNFDDLFKFLRTHDILLLGIKAEFYENEKAVVDWDEVVKRLKQETKMIKDDNPDQRFSDHLKRQYMINPYGIEKYYIADEDDKLIVLARSGKDIEKIK